MHTIGDNKLYSLLQPFQGQLDQPEVRQTPPTPHPVQVLYTPTTMPPSAADSSSDPRSASSKAKDLIARGDYTPTPWGKTTFFLLRSIEPFLQYSILAHGLGTPLLHRFGLRTLPPGLPTNTGISLIDGLQLSPYRLVLFGMALGAAVKQNIWVTALSGEPMPVGGAVAVGAFNAVFNSLSSYAFLLRATSASLESSFPQPALLIGSAMYVVGIVTELVAEVQRKRFKADPANKGKAYTGGLWRFARHVNYGGYTLWRAGYAVAGGGYTMGAIVGAFFFWDFSQRAVPILNEYCEKRYGAAWEKFKRDTPWRLIPFVY
jgi:protein-S-isoprenylcysteine O-methyltransferase Ste14